MTISREALKSACTLELDARGERHPAESNFYSGRYVLETYSGRVALMLEKGSKGPAHIWLPSRVTAHLASPTGREKSYPASELWTKMNQDGELTYGRHSGLQAMPELENANLTRITLETVQELRDILSDLGC